MVLANLTTNNVTGDNSVVIGPGFNREVTIPNGWTPYYSLDYTQMLELEGQYANIICTWGNTAFESVYLGAKVTTITLYPEHDDEAQCLGVPYVNRVEVALDTKLMPTYCDMPMVDLDGAKRLVKVLEDIYYSFGVQPVRWQ
jgi:hypothetical protein